jgi:hypothetical protein
VTWREWDVLGLDGDNVAAQTSLIVEAAREKLFMDTVSGKLTRRPRGDACLDYMRPGDHLVVTPPVRVACSLRHLSDIVAEMERGTEGAREDVSGPESPAEATQGLWSGRPR